MSRVPSATATVSRCRAMRGACGLSSTSFSSAASIVYASRVDESPAKCTRFVRKHRCTAPRSVGNSEAATAPAATGSQRWRGHAARAALLPGSISACETGFGPLNHRHSPGSVRPECRTPQSRSSEPEQYKLSEKCWKLGARRSAAVAASAAA